jgi:site-specific DNA-methyltransferase (adenine-specific)
MKSFGDRRHKIVQGDVIEVLQGRRIKNNSVDLIFADPPYNIGKIYNGFKDKWYDDFHYITWCYDWIDLALEKLKDNGSFYLMASTQFMPYLDTYLANKVNIVSRIIWHYDSSGVQAKKSFGSLYEPILHCVKNKEEYVFNSDEIKVKTKTGAARQLIDYRKTPPSRYNDLKVPGNVWYFPRVRYRMEEYEEHPTQKPIQLLERIIKTSSNPEDLVLDIFSGTFTTAFVAKELNRRSISIEADNEYIEIGLRRVLDRKRLNGKKLYPVEKPYKRVNSIGTKDIS